MTRSRPDHRVPIILSCFASAPRQTIMLPGGSPPGIAPAASGRRGTDNRSRVGNPYPVFGVSGCRKSPRLSTASFAAQANLCPAPNDLPANPSTADPLLGPISDLESVSINKTEAPWWLDGVPRDRRVRPHRSARCGMRELVPDPRCGVAKFAADGPGTLSTSVSRACWMGPPVTRFSIAPGHMGTRRCQSKTAIERALCQSWRTASVDPTEAANLANVCAAMPANALRRRALARTSFATPGGTCSVESRPFRESLFARPEGAQSWRAHRLAVFGRCTPTHQRMDGRSACPTLSHSMLARLGPVPAVVPRASELLHRLGDRLLIGESRLLVLLHGVEEMGTQFLPYVLSKHFRATDTPAGSD